MMACLWNRVRRWISNDGYYLVDKTPHELEEENRAKREMLDALASTRLRIREQKAAIAKASSENKDLYEQQARYMQMNDGVANQTIKSQVESNIRRANALHAQLKELLIQEEQAERLYQSALNAIETDHLRKRTIFFMKKTKVPEAKDAKNDAKELSDKNASIKKVTSATTDDTGVGGLLEVEELTIEEQHNRELEAARQRILVNNMPDAPTRTLASATGPRVAIESRQPQPPPPPPPQLVTMNKK